MQEIQTGIHVGKVKDYGMTETEGKPPSVFVTFDVEFNDVTVAPFQKYTKQLTWRGYLNEGKALEITLKALCLALNMRGMEITALADGPEGGPIDLGREAALDIQEQEYEGKTHKKIAWVNPVGFGAGVGKRITSAEAKAKLAARNLTGAVAAFKQKEGIKDGVGF